MTAGADPELSSVDALVQAAFLVQGILERRAAEHGLSLIQLRLLGILRDRRPTIKELAALLELDKSSVSGLVDRAERRGLVRRIPSQIDRRSVRVAPTVEARSLIDERSAQVTADIEEVLRPLSLAEQGELTRSLQRMLVERATSAGVDLLRRP